MTAIARNRTTPIRGPILGALELAVENAKIIYEGTLVALKAGELTPAIRATGLIGLGCAAGYVDNTADGLLAVVQFGTYLWKNGTSTDEITASDIGGVAWIQDNQTVGKLPYIAGTPRVETITFGTANATQYAVSLNVTLPGELVSRTYLFNYVSDGSGTPTEAADAYREWLAAIPELTGYVTGTGTATAVVTGAEGVAFTNTDVGGTGGGTSSVVVTTAGTNNVRSFGGRIYDVETAGVWVTSAPWIK